MNFAIGIIIYNPDIDVKKRVLNYSKLTSEIYLFDNTTETNLISEEFASIFKDNYVRYNNIGLSKAMEFFLKKTKINGIDILLTMDQDSEFHSESILKMLKKIEMDDNSNYAIYCPNYRKIYFDDNGTKIPGKCKIREDSEVDVNFSMTSGSFYVMKNFNIDTPLIDLFIGYVDYDICFELISKGYKICMVGWIIFDQTVGEQVKNTSISKLLRVLHHKPERYYYMIRNNFYLQNKFKNKKALNRVLKKDVVRIIFNIIIGERKKIDKLKSTLKGYSDFKNNVLGKYNEQ